MKHLVFLVFVLLAISCQAPADPPIQLEGELQQWHKVTLVIDGPESSENALDNPFLDYRLDVAFSNGIDTYFVPGYFAADGVAGESSAVAGSVWKVHFRPNAAGTWNYRVSFKKGKNIAVLDGDAEGDAVEADGSEGTLEIAPSDKSAPDFRAGGNIVNGGKGYFKQQGTDEIWIKNGADSPENFLAFSDFDQTIRFSLKRVFREGEANPEQNVHDYEPHLADWQEGDPTWQNGKGKGIIGALNYLHSTGVNSVYMLTMNILGDGKDVWPYTDYNERYRFDCSKLDQWELVFEYMEQLGMMAHFVLQETENECLLDVGYTDVQRRVYLRELVARFGHHLALTWNMGEENGPMDWTPIGQTHQQKIDMANYLKAINPWPCNLVLHTHSNDSHQDLYLEPMLGFVNLDGPSMQVASPYRVHQRVKKWVEESEKAGKRWLVNLDEIGPHWQGVMPDANDPNHDTVRHHCLWGSLMAGGGGVEWYFGYRFPHNDLNLEDFRSREAWWKQSTLATQFVARFPLEEMDCQDELVDAEGAYCLAKEAEVYIVYLPAGTSAAKLQLDAAGTYDVFWFNPRTGGDLSKGSVTSFQGAGKRLVGAPPSDPGKDWVVVVERSKVDQL